MATGTYLRLISEKSRIVVASVCDYGVEMGEMLQVELESISICQSSDEEGLEGLEGLSAGDQLHPETGGTR